MNSDKHKIFNDHMELAVKVALKFKRRNISREDLIQESYRSLWEAVISFKPGKTKFSTYAHHVIYNDFLNLFEPTKTKKNRYDTLASKDAVDFNYFEDDGNIDTLIEAVEYFNLLNDKDRGIVLDWLAGNSFQDMADKSKSKNPDHKKQGHYHHRFNTILKLLKSGEYQRVS